MRHTCETRDYGTNLTATHDVSESPDGNQQPRENGRRGVSRVAIVGTGLVGSTTAYALLLSGTAAEILLIDRTVSIAEGHVHDLRDAELFSYTTCIFPGDYSDCANADVIIITAGLKQDSRPRSRLDDLNESSLILKDIIREIARHNPRGVLLIASNPVDVLTYAAQKWSGLPAGRVIGSGTSLDTSRLRRRIAAHYGVAPENVHAYVVGEHGDSQVALLSTARIAGIPLEEFSRYRYGLSEKPSLTTIADAARWGGQTIRKAKGATNYGIAAALTRITGVILRNEHAILTVSSRVPEWMDLGDVSLSLPSVVNNEGIARVLSAPMNITEERALQSSAELLKGYLAKLDL